MKKYLHVYFSIGTCWIHYEEKIPWVQMFFWSSAIARMEWNGMTDIIPIIPIIDPLSDRTGTATVPECKWVVSEWWIEWLYKWWKSVLYRPTADVDLSNSGHFIRHKWEIKDDLYPNKKLYDLLFYAPVSSYGHVGTVSSPNKAWTSGNKDLVHILLPFPDSNPSWMNQRNGEEWP